MAEEDLRIQSQANIWGLICAYVDSIVLKCALDLNIADIINSDNHPITLLEIADGISSLSLDINYLSRIMLFLVRKHFFTSQLTEYGTTVLYGLTHAAKWILQDAKFTLAPVLRTQSQEAWLNLHHLNKCVEEGDVQFHKAHEHWDNMVVNNPESNKFFNEPIACLAKIVADAMLLNYKKGFDGVRSLVMVGGGAGLMLMMAEIVKAHPHISGINFDLPHAVATAPDYPGVGTCSCRFHKLIL